VGMLSQRCQDSVGDPSQGETTDDAAQGIGVSTLRHEPFGYQRLTTTLAL
jgi:hypothetical protein